MTHKLIAALENIKPDDFITKRHEDRYEAIDDCIALVKQHMEGHTLVPNGWLKVAMCPDHNCNDGVVAVPVGDNELSAEQCRFCYEKGAMLSASGEGADS